MLSKLTFMLDEGKFLSEMLVGPDHDVPWLMWIVAALCWPVCGSSAELGITGSAQTWCPASAAGRGRAPASAMERR